MHKPYALEFITDLSHCCAGMYVGLSNAHLQVWPPESSAWSCTAMFCLTPQSEELLVWSGAAALADTWRSASAHGLAITAVVFIRTYVMITFPAD